MKVKLSILTVFLCVSLCTQLCFAVPKDSWTTVKSTNFFLIGNASQKDIVDVATKLEQFRDVFTRLFPALKFNSPVPTTVVVFKNDSSYRPFKPSPNLAGYFQPGTDVNYITLTADRSSEQPFRVIFHEYVHQLVNNTLGDQPAWFNEGLAEYYSTFTIDKDQIIKLGLVVPEHLELLRSEKMLPFRTLFSVDHNSPYYNERAKQSIFYAQSWALVHYLVLGDNEKRLPQIGKFLQLLSSGVGIEKAFPEAFETNFETVEKELKEYVRRNSHPGKRVTFERKLELASEMKTGSLSEADAQAYLGDLLVHINLLSDAERRLEEALVLDPNSSQANTSLGILKTREGKFVEAKTALQRAVAGNTQNPLAHYYYAYALSREHTDGAGMVEGFSPENATIMRAELKRAISILPAFPESYSLLAFVNLVAGTQIDESIDLLNKGLVYAAGHHEMKFMLAQLYLKKQDFRAARELLEPLVANAPDAEIRTHAKTLLDQVSDYETRLAQFKSLQASRSEQNSPGPPKLRSRTTDSTNSNEGAGDDDSSQDVTITRPSFRKPEEGQSQLKGQLVKIECGAKGIVLDINDGQRTFRFAKGSLTAIKFISYVADMGSEITCGPRNPANYVIVTFKPPTNKASKSDGDPVVLEFIPKESK